MGFVDYISPHEVDSVESLALYIQQTTGTPYPTQGDMRVLQQKCKKFFESYPHLDYATLVRVADWARANHRRYDRVWKVVESFRYAWRAGALADLDPNGNSTPKLEEQVREAVMQETDPEWRRKLLLADGAAAQMRVLRAWESSRTPALF